MDFNLNRTGSRIILLIGQVVVLFMCLGYIDYIYFDHIYPDQQASANFHQVNCFIESKKLTSNHEVLQAYRADFLVSYTVDGVKYSRWISDNGLDASFNRDRAAEEETLSEYELGGTYICYYDPDDPQTAVLVLRHNWLSTFPLILPAVISVLVFYYLLANIVDLIILTRTKLREKKH